MKLVNLVLFSKSVFLYVYSINVLRYKYFWFNKSGIGKS